MFNKIVAHDTMHYNPPYNHPIENYTKEKKAYYTFLESFEIKISSQKQVNYIVSWTIQRINLQNTKRLSLKLIKEHSFMTMNQDERFCYPDKLNAIPSLRDDPALMERLISEY